MHFATPQFAYFLALTLTVSWALRAHPTRHKAFLLAASYFFYARFTPWLTALLLTSSTLNWAAGELLARKNLPVRQRRLVLWGALVFNLGLLGLFKYYGFFQQTAQEAAEVLGLTAHLPVLELVMPMGISFFTFQGLAYVIDFHRGRGVRAASLLDFLLFIAFFPKLLAGPITRGRELLPQFAVGPPERVVELPRAVALIASGLFKKAVLATLIGVRLVDEAFLAPENYSSGALAMAAFAYSIQLYCDFSGYTDVARGVALLLGYRLPENFNAPYAATDPGRFWRRWHASFSSWLRDYVYFPLGGSKGSLFRTCRNLVVTFTLCGLWHGASWGYILWGALHGVVLCLHKLVREGRKAVGLTGREPGWWLFLGWFFTFNIVVFSRILFRAGDLQTAGDFFARILAFAPGQGFDLWVVLASLIGLSLNFIGRDLRNRFIAFHERIPVRWAPVLWGGIGVALLAVQPGDVAPYIYFQF
ncbi:MAG TPA: MBOAT family O-acyltransferase [Myxococcaceae bacterium]|nr:MBOAT family O-acyltransferase [Myxococcaceae bacterium]